MKKKKVSEEKVDLLCPLCGKFVHTRQIWSQEFKEYRTEYYCQCGWRFD
jgi:predicted RNA-binding Zn-ribbon protein involved in translation (DUF1610 family)